MEKKLKLPDGWSSATVGEVSTKIQYGYTASANKNKVGPKLLRITDIQKGIVDWDAVPYCQIPKEKIDNYSLRAGDIVFARTGATTGKSFLIRSNHNSIFASYLIRVRPSVCIDPAFLYFFFNTPSYWKLISENISGNAQPNCNASKLSALPLFVPPFAEQKRIVEKVETVLAQVNAVRERLHRVPALLKRFRKAVLAAACSGRLTEGWRAEHSDMTRINPKNCLNEKLGKIDINETYFEPPRTWGWVRFGSQAKLINGDRGKNYPNKSEYVTKGIPFINTGHIEPNGTLSFERMNYITREKFDALRSGKIQPNDLVYCLRGATIGKTAIVNPFIEGAIASSLVIVRSEKSTTSKFAYLFLVSPPGKNLIQRFDNGTAQPNLAAKSVALYPMALPPIEEQKEIVHRVEALFKLADAIEARVDSSRAGAEKLTQAILAKAFRGELVPTEAELARREGRDYETAEALLERVKCASS